jgi:hypothetical protein
MLGLVGRQDILLAIGYALDIVGIVIVSRQGYMTLEVIDIANVLEVMLSSVLRPGILTHEPHDEVFLTPHRFIGDILQTVSDAHAISPSCLIDYLDNFLFHLYGGVFFEFGRKGSHFFAKKSRWGG